MMTRRLILICMALLLGMAALSPSPALAQGQTQVQKEMEDQKQNLEQQTTFCVDPPTGSSVAGIDADDWKKKYTARLVYCMRNILEEGAKKFLQVIIKGFVLPTLGPIIIFAMALFGIKVALGMFRGSPKAEAANFLFKVGVIAGLLGVGTLPMGGGYASDILVDFWFDTTDMMVEVVAAGAAALFSSSYCPSKVANIGNWIAIFDRFDCLFAKFAGFGKNVLAASGVVFIAAAALFSGWLGIGFFFIALAALYVMAQFMFRAAMLVLLSYGGLALMIMVFPLFLPLLLFKRTEDFFYRGWLSISVGFVIQPALTIAFLFFAVAVMDDYLINGSRSTYVRYNYGTNSTEVKSFAPGTTVPPDYISAHEPWHKVLGLPLDGTRAEQAVAIKRFMVPQRSGSLPLMQSDPANTGYMDNLNCGNYGLQNLSGDDVLKEAAKDDKAVALCTDKAKCKDALENNLSNAPSETTKVRTKDILCGQGRNSTPLSLAQNARGGNALDASIRTMGLNLNFQNTTTGALPPGQTPDLQDLSNTRMMRLIGSMGAIIILAGSFYVFLKHIPGMVQRVAGGPSMSLSLSSPYVMGQKLGDRVQAGLMKGKEGWVSSLSKGSDGKRGSMLNRLGGGALKGFAQGVVTGEKSFVG